MNTRLRLRILLPYGTFADWPDVVSLTVPTIGGSLGVLPNRLDCATAVRPGLLAYRRQDSPEEFVAVDAGVFVKAGAAVTLSVHDAVAGAALGKLHAAVREKYGHLDDAQRAARTLAARLELDFSRRLVELSHER